MMDVAWVSVSGGVSSTRMIPHLCNYGPSDNVRLIHFSSILPFPNVGRIDCLREFDMTARGVSWLVDADKSRLADLPKHRRIITNCPGC